MGMTLEHASETVVKQCMAVQPGEEVLILVDAKSRRIGEALFAVCAAVKAEPVLMEIKERTLHGDEPPPLVAAAMKAGKVVIAPTTKSISHTRARREACQAGARIASMPGITEELMLRTMGSDYVRIGELTTRLAEALRGAKTARVTSPGGTDLTMSIEGRECHADTGILIAPGTFGNLPAGEAYTAPVEGSSNGTIVVDGAMAGVERIDSPIVVKVENGEALEITGGDAANRLRDMIESAHDRSGRNIAELGIGTNENAGLSGNLLEVEKVLGTVHFAFGDNVSMGGLVKAPIHVDGVVLRPTLVVDGKTLVRDGVILV